MSILLSFEVRLGNFMLKALASLLFFSLSVSVFSQTPTGILYVSVTDAAGDAVIGVNVFSKDAPSKGTVTDEKGNYVVTIPAGENVLIVYSAIGFESDTQKISLKPNQKRELNISLSTG